MKQDTWASAIATLRSLHGGAEYAVLINPDDREAFLESDDRAELEQLGVAVYTHPEARPGEWMTVPVFDLEGDEELETVLDASDG